MKTKANERMQVSLNPAYGLGAVLSFAVTHFWNLAASRRRKNDMAHKAMDPRSSQGGSSGGIGIVTLLLLMPVTGGFCDKKNANIHSPWERRPGGLRSHHTILGGRHYPTHAR